MMLPDKLLIGGYTYSVEYVDADDLPYFGKVDFNSKTIVISARGLTEDRLVNTMLHEVLHAVYHEAGSSELENPDEEWWVLVGTNGMCQVYRDNPVLVEMLDRHYNTMKGQYDGESE